MSCAGQVPPSGGPPDTTPPVIIGTTPDTNATRARPEFIEIRFSEYVDRRSVEEAVFVSPYLGQPEFDWSGTEVRIRYPEPLRGERTYVLTVGTDVVDLRARNRMAAGFTLAFSTGDSIDRGEISGRVFDEKPEGVMIFAYALDTRIPDTLNPAQVKPDYIMQTGSDGRFVLSNIAVGAYRVVAVRDEYRNFLYDKQIDQFGVPAGDFFVRADLLQVPDVWLRLTTEDTTKPFVTSAQANDRYAVTVRFSEPLDSASFYRSAIELADTLGGHRVEIVLAYLSRTNPAIAGLVTGSPLDSLPYRVRVGGVFDRAGNPIDTANARAVFPGTVRPDTVRPTFQVAEIHDSARGVPLDRAIELRFSEPVLQGSASRGAVLRDSSGRPVKAETAWLGPTDLFIRPVERLLSRAWYQLTMVMDSLSDLRGNRYVDSVFVLRFETFDLRSTGTIEGRIEDAQAADATGPLYVTVRDIDRKPSFTKSVKLAGEGRFVMEEIPEGRYQMSAFRDSDSSGVYTYGSPFPFVPAERFVVGADTLKVRARWGVEGVLLQLK